jgi:Ca2+-binding RTX toxin-like protein
MVIEKAGEGFDTVDTSISYTLTANVESLRLIGITGAVDAHGNDGNNWLNAVWVDVAPAAGTMIRLFGEGGNDNLLGSRYSDLLDGGAGADRMTGGFGNDRYVVDNVGDMVIEKAGEGFDTVDTSISYTLTANVESLRLIGITGAVDAHGNAGNNWLNAAWVDVAPAAGTMIRLFGEGGNDNLLGSRYGDLLDGGAGSDMLTGGAGNDRFHFGDVLDAATNVDTILDFQKGDVIELDDAIFSALSAGALDAGQFVANADGVATSADNRIIYDTDSGQLFYDADGSLGGAAILFGVVAGHPPLTGADFVVV